MTMVGLGLLILALASFCLECFATENVWMPNFTRLFWTSSAVTPNGKWLYVDGGEIWNGTFTVFDYALVLQSTVAIDLSQSWTNSTLPTLHSTFKPDNFPSARKPTVWYSPSDNTLYSYGGAVYKYDDGCKRGCNSWKGWRYNGRGGYANRVGYPSADTPLWQLKADESGLAYGSWVPSPEHTQPGGIAPPTFEGLATTAGGDLWNLGGLVSEPDSAWTIPGLAKFDGATKIWTNSTPSPVRYSTSGKAISAPSFGTSGVLIYFGGASSSKQFTTSDASSLKKLVRAMSEIGVYDIESGAYYTQSAGGDSIPPPTLEACAVGVEDAQGHFDIFMYGGRRADDDFGSAYGTVYVLSIPSFRWTKINGDNVETEGRAFHTCEVIGRRQMVSIGGTTGSVPSDADPFTNGIGVFDMSELSWSSQYDADAKPYVRAGKLATALKGYDYPSHWDSQALETIFTLSPDNKPSADSSSDSGTSNIGVIAGAVVGGTIGVALLVGITWYFLRRRRRQRHERDPAGYEAPLTMQHEYFAPEKNASPLRQELHAESMRSELDGSQEAELPTSAWREAWEIGSHGTLVGSRKQSPTS